MAEREPPRARQTRRKSVGRSSGETYLQTRHDLAPGCVTHRIMPADAASALPRGKNLADYDAVFLSGSPLSLHENSPEARRSLAFMVAVFRPGTPSFGSCAGLQLATVAAGGSVRPNRDGPEAGSARRITPTEAEHPMLRGRPAAFDAPSIHADEVEALPGRTVLLAGNRSTAVQAAESRHGGGTFWGVQYHLEIELDEVGTALRRQAEDFIEVGLARDRGEVEAQAGLVEVLHREPCRRDLMWRLGLDEEVTVPDRRQVELRNFVEELAVPVRAERRQSGRRC